MMSEHNLKSCPLCKHTTPHIEKTTAMFVGHFPYDKHPVTFYSVKCPNCGLSTSWRFTGSGAVELWDTLCNSIRLSSIASRLSSQTQNKGKFSQGQWLITDGIGISDKDIRSIDEPGQVICSFLSYGAGERKLRDANARLIASAPEMYELLHKLLGYACEVQNMSTSTAYKSVIQTDIDRVDELLDYIDNGMEDATDDD